MILNQRFSRLLLALAASLLLAPAAHAAKDKKAPPPPPFIELAETREFIAEMAERHGFDADELTRTFSVARPNATVLRAIVPAAVPEQQRSWTRYRERFLNARRIERGLAFWEEHGAELVRAEAIYGVPREIIVAIIGVETEYGRNTGRFRVLEALASLAFKYPPRAPFFRSELEHFLLLARENGMDAFEVRGSYAGAMGIPQFMPSSQRRYAVDFDGDGRIDLRASESDAIGSVASFLAHHGWQTGAPITAPAHIEGDAARLLAAGIKPSRPLRELQAEGVVTGPETAGDAERPTALIDLVDPVQPTEYWVGYDNFYVITRYNRSTFYAMSVFQLAEALRAGQAQ